jgi:flagellar L-ring protein precursor FlgH
MMITYKRTIAYLTLSTICAGLLGACASADRPTLLQTPTTARPKPILETSANMGSLYPNSGGAYVSMVSHRPLFEDRRARNVGDTLTVILNETTSAAKNSSMSAARKATATTKFTNGGAGIPKNLYKGIAEIANFDGTGELKSEGAGGSAANNTFAGTITVTVIEILSNGNLVVAGEKQVAISNEEEIIRFGGIVNPNNLVANRISSQEVADARIEYRGRGATDDTQGTGWFTRLLLKMAPF